MSWIDVSLKDKLTGHKDCIYALEKGADAHTIFTSGSDALVVKWDLRAPEKGVVVAKVQNTVYALCYIPAFHTLVVGQNFEGIHLIDLHTNQEIRSVKLTDKAIFDIKYLDNSLWVGTGGGEIITVDYEHFNIKERQKLSADACRCLTFRPHSTHELAAGFSDHKIRILDAKSLEVRQELVGHKNSVFSLAFSPNGNQLLSGSRDAHLRFWDPTHSYGQIDTIIAHMYTINAISFDESGKYFASCSKDKSIKVWHTAKRKLLKVIDKARHAGHGTSVNKLLWSAEDQLVSCSDDRTASVWSLKFNI